MILILLYTVYLTVLFPQTCSTFCANYVWFLPHCLLHVCKILSWYNICDPWLLLSTCQSVFKQGTRCQIAPDVLL